MNTPSLLIEFDLISWKPTVYLNGATDKETAKLQEIADKVVETIREVKP